MPLSVNDIVQVTIGGLKDQQTVMNTVHFQCTTAASTGTPAENMASLLDHLWDNATGIWFDPWLALMPDDYTLQTVRAQRVAPTRSAYIEQLVVAAGTAVNVAAETANLTWVLVKQSELAGRRGKGTMHILLASPEHYTNGLLNVNGATPRLTWASLIDDQVTVTAGGVYVPVIFHPNFSPNFSRITHATIKQEVRTMRRRTVGRGI
jgi:hypothetical protein